MKTKENVTLPLRTRTFAASDVFSQRKSSDHFTGLAKIISKGSKIVQNVWIFREWRVNIGNGTFEKINTPQPKNAIGPNTNGPYKRLTKESTAPEVQLLKMSCWKLSMLYCTVRGCIFPWRFVGRFLCGKGMIEKYRLNRFSKLEIPTVPSVWQFWHILR